VGVVCKQAGIGGNGGYHVDFDSDCCGRSDGSGPTTMEEAMVLGHGVSALAGLLRVAQQRWLEGTGGDGDVGARHGAQRSVVVVADADKVKEGGAEWSSQWMGRGKVAWSVGVGCRVSKSGQGTDASGWLGKGV